MVVAGGVEERLPQVGRPWTLRGRAGSRWALDLAGALGAAVDAMSATVGILPSFMMSTRIKAPGAWRSYWRTSRLRARTGAPVAGSVHDNRGHRHRVRMWCTVETFSPRWYPIRAGTQRWETRNPTTRRSRRRLVRCGHDRGRLDRSTIPADPTSR